MIRRIEMPVTVDGVCTVCGYEQQVDWSKYGSITDCVNCDEPAAYVEKVEK
jgi:hypothetical protein